MPMMLLLVATSFAQPPKITLSKETTFAVEPLRADGVIDYIGAVNALYADVKPDENAAVMLVQAFGPQSTTPALAKEHFRRLGCEPPSPTGQYLVDVETFAKEVGVDVETLQSDIEVSGRRPWKKNERPKVAALLDRNAAALDVVVGASRKPKYYAPILCERDPPLLMYCPLKTLERLRAAVGMLLSRAMLRLGDEDLEGATADLSACHRLAKLLSAGPRAAIEGFIALSLFERAMEAERVLAASGLLSLEGMNIRKTRLAALPPPINPVKTIDAFERLAMLSAVVYTLNSDLQKAFGQNAKQMNEVSPLLDEADFDADEALRTVNQYFDRLVTAAAPPPNWDTKLAVEKVGEPLRLLRFSRTFGDAPEITPHSKGRKAAVGRRIGEVFLEVLTPKFDLCVTGVMKAQVAQRFTVLSYALAAHKHKNGDYPRALDAESLGVDPKAIIDPFIERPFTYRIENGKRQIVCANFDGQVGFYKAGDRVTNRCDDVVIELP